MPGASRRESVRKSAAKRLEPESGVPSPKGAFQFAVSNLCLYLKQFMRTYERRKFTYK